MMTPEQAKAAMQMRARAKAKLSGKVATAIVEAPEPSWGEALGDMVQNSQPADWKKTFVDPLLHPIDTINSIGGMADALSEKIPGMTALNDFAAEHGATAPRDPERIAKGDEALGGLSEHFGRYTTRRGMKENVAKGIPSLLGDASILLPAPKGLGLLKKTSPEKRAAGLVDKLMKENPGAEKALRDLGPDGIVADVLGKKGRDAVKTATKHSSEAADIMNDVTTKRSMPDVREKVLNDKLEAVNDAGRPSVHKAYEDAAASGGGIKTVRVNNPKGSGYKEVPDGLEPLFENGEIQKMYEDSAVKTQTRNVTDGSVDNEFAKLQATVTALREEATRSIRDTRQGTSGKSRADMLSSAADHIDTYLEKNSSGYPDAMRLHKELQQQKEAIKLQHDLDSKGMKETQRSIHKGELIKEPTAGLAEALTISGAGIAGGLIASGNIAGGLAATIASMGPIAIKAVRKSGYKKALAESPELARIMADSKLPLRKKKTLFDKAKTAIKAGGAIGLPGMLTGDREGRSP